MFDSVYLVLGTDTIAIDSSLSETDVSLTIDSGFTIPYGSSHSLTVLCDISPDAPLGNYVLGLMDSMFCDLIDQNLLTTVYPILNAADYPVLSAEVSLVKADLETSFTNYPNPFNPDGEGRTTIGYVLTSDARVDIELFTITGELVKQVAIGAFRGAGAHQEDTWDGRNDRGGMVLPGTYFCRLTAKYVGGGSETIKRKIAVVR
ncbi:MAG: hypothetical protein JSV52_15375 [Candidatus Zixiibacteriota bacterium]|nr:MAG: hypothetical protein JSV52_15375 [candidate division Zixibacteria bacterium]